MMSRDITDVIDDYCRSKYGHSNWAWFDHVEMGDNWQEKGNVEGNIIFYFEPYEEEDNE